MEHPALHRRSNDEVRQLPDSATAEAAPISGGSRTEQGSQ
jgi:hypothetical protein